MIPDRIRVLCVEDHRIVLDGIAMIIDSQADMKVVATATNGREAFDKWRQQSPDVTLMDLQLPVVSGLEVIHLIRSEDAEARIIILTTYHGEEDIYRGLEAGASTYLLKETVADNLIATIREVHAGKRPIPPDVAARLAIRVGHRTLTAQEVAVMELIGKGMRNKEIGAALGITEGTVVVHLRNMFFKLDVHDRTAALAVAVRRGIIHIN
jgi:two-component system NarL family response regulator